MLVQGKRGNGGIGVWSRRWFQSRLWFQSGSSLWFQSKPFVLLVGSSGSSLSLLNVWR